ncbi:MAG: hypothetical protein HY436_01750, partial [Candidatus Liptonbacteria bacterium]|nr:hypothetical protein [Candidatus Liptonbacteria bacterium]
MGNVKTLFGIAAVCALLLRAPGAHAAETAAFSFDANASEAAPDSILVVRLLVASAAPLNAYRLILRYPPQLLTLMKFDNSRSLITVWQSPPAVSQGGTIELVGGSTEPFSGANGELGAFVFRAAAEGEARITADSAEAYIADGKGTKAESRTAPLVLRIAPDAPLIYEETKVDNAPPSVEFIALIADPFNPSQKLLSFNVKDAETGVGETRVRTRTFLAWSEWRRAQNPVALAKTVWA